MSKFVAPSVYCVGYTEMDDKGVLSYLKDSGNDDFYQSIVEAREAGISNLEILCSMFAKRCYKSLTEGKNANITRVRSIENNLRGTFDAGHGSVFEHVGFNFVITDCSRVFTHELVRHRIGTAFSQNSGRYIRLDTIDLVFDPILAPVQDRVTNVINYIEKEYAEMVKIMGLDTMKDFTKKKKITSALRRIAPTGQSNEIGFSVNLRSLRHTIMMRTGRHSEWEIRLVFQEIYLQLKDRYPTIFHGATETVIDGLIEVSGMKMQPYEKESDIVLEECTTEQIQQLLAIRLGTTTDKLTEVLKQVAV